MSLLHNTLGCRGIKSSPLSITKKAMAHRELKIGNHVPVRASKANQLDREEAGPNPVTILEGERLEDKKNLG